jgi:hypothetical protein
VLRCVGVVVRVVCAATWRGSSRVRSTRTRHDAPAGTYTYMNKYVYIHLDGAYRHRCPLWVSLAVLVQVLDSGVTGLCLSVCVIAACSSRPSTGTRPSARQNSAWHTYRVRAHLSPPSPLPSSPSPFPSPPSSPPSFLPSPPFPSPLFSPLSFCSNDQASVWRRSAARPS